MKKILLGTTGLVAVAMLATAANAAETPKVTLGGFSDFQSGWTSDDRDAGERSNGFRNDNEITVKVDGKTGSLGYGAEINLEADITDDADNQGTNASRTFTYLEGGFGRVELGSNKSVAATMRLDASSVAAATGGINGSWTYFVQPGAAAANFITTSKLVTEHGNVSNATLGDESTYNATKVSYYTPKFSGFQAGASYTPKHQDRGQTLGRSDTAGLSDVIDLGLGYEGTLGGVKLAAAGTYEMADGEGALAGAFGTDDVKAWNLGAVVGFMGFDVAGSYGDWSDSGIAGVDGDYWTAGLGYDMGPIGASVTYLTSDLGTSEFENIVLGADYKLAAGLTPYAEVSFYDFDAAGTASDNEGTTFILGTQVAF